MIRKGAKIAVLYLEDWQKRMIKDFLHVDCNTYEVGIGGSNPTTKYGLPPAHEGTKRMYLTDWQIRELRDEAGVVCEFIELHESAIHTLYKVEHQ